MNSAQVCPECQQPLTQVGKHWICPEHGQIPAHGNRGDEAQTSAVTSAPLRIFLSYGHDANEELVRRIKADLEKRGHDVWFDKNEIKFGDEWRRAITDGITGSNRVLSFLSKHSTRDPGVCLDEIAIAIGVKGGNIQTILVESDFERYFYSCHQHLAHRAMELSWQIDEVAKKATAAMQSSEPPSKGKA